MPMTADEILSIVANRPDAYAGAETQIAADRLALMQAMAQAGSAGKAAYETAKANAAANQAIALQQVAALAEAGNAPQGLIDSIAARVNQGSNEQLGYMSANQGNWSNYYDAMTQSNDAYLGRLSSVIPMYRQQANDSLTVNLNSLMSNESTQLAKIKQEAALQLANLQYQDYLRQEGYKREDQLRAEDWAHQLELLKMGSGGGGGGYGGRYGGGSSGWTPARWQHDPTTGDPFGNLGEAAATTFANAAYSQISARTPYATFDEGATTSSNRELKFTADGRPYWGRSSDPVSALSTANASRAYGILDNADIALNGGVMFGLTEQMLNDDNYADLVERVTMATPEIYGTLGTNRAITSSNRPTSRPAPVQYGPPAPARTTSTVTSRTTNRPTTQVGSRITSLGQAASRARANTATSRARQNRLRNT